MNVHALLLGELNEGVERFDLINSTAVLANDWRRLKRTTCNNEHHALNLVGGNRWQSSKGTK